MALVVTSWVMGSDASVPETTITVTANAVTEAIVIAAGGYFPFDGTAAQSAAHALATALQSHSEITTCTPLLGRDRLIRITCDLSFTIDAWSDLTLRNVLGFTGTEAFAAVTQTAGRSAYLWSPGRCEIPDAPLGCDGIPYADTARGMSGDAVVIATTHNTGKKNSLRWSMVEVERVMTVAELPGEFLRWWHLCGITFARWKVYRDITEETTATDSTDAGVISASVLGPYALDMDGSGPMEMDFARSEERMDLFADIEIPGILVSAY
jgi:hypothetical protein